MQTVPVAAVSLNSELGKHDQTLRRMEQFCEQAATDRAELVVFSELIVHGHCAPNTWEIAEQVAEGESAPHCRPRSRRQFFVQTLVGGLVCSLYESGRTQLGAQEQGEKNYDLLVKGGNERTP